MILWSRIDEELTVLYWNSISSRTEDKVISSKTEEEQNETDPPVYLHNDLYFGCGLVKSSCIHDLLK